MQAFNPNTNDHDYSVVVMVENRGFPDDQSLVKFPQVSIAWNVFKSYHVIQDGTGTTTRSRNPITNPDTTHKFNALQSLPSHEIISNMLHELHISFPLDRLRWKPSRFVKDTEPLNSVDDTINNIRRAIDGMVSAGQRKKLDVIVTVDKQIKISQQQYDAMVARREVEQMLNDFRSMLSREGLLQQPHEEARDQATSSVDALRWRLVRSHLNEIRSRAAAAGMLMNNINVNFNYEGSLDVNEILIEMGMLMEELPDDHEARLLRAKPATKASVEALAKLIKIDGVNYGTNSEYCVVCMEKMLRGEEVTCMPCSHLFHADCLVQWLKLRHTCPICRFKLPTD
ncbi:PREDICTED: E3 [Prunus dulcis]|uniref:RING-type E3 ubiquitin transferase n=1 Tax=Prunus dulcis TaxID=3755 RepID=A0A5E4F607_PRUDU|nr:PREDICTED: E3 [Prunus dulcis]